MLRVNAFFTLKSDAEIEAAKTIGDELVKKSRADKGCIAYDLFQSATNPLVMMFCETWADEQSLMEHAGQPHFTLLVPRMEALAAGPLKLEKFEF